MKDGKWYVAQVQVPSDLTPDEVTNFIEDLAQGLERADHRMKGQRTKPRDYPTKAKAAKAAKTVAAPAPTDGYQPLYFCHNK